MLKIIKVLKWGLSYDAYQRFVSCPPVSICYYAGFRHANHLKFMLLEDANIRYDYFWNLDAYKTDIKKILFSVNADICMDAFVNKQIRTAENRGTENLKIAIQASHKRQSLSR